MSKDRSIQAQSLMKSILPYVPREQWEAATREALRIHDAIVGEAPAATPAATNVRQVAPAAQAADEYTLTARISKMQRDDANKVYCVLADERAEINHHGSAWRADGQAMERFSVGDEIEVTVKEVAKNGKVFKNFSRPRKPVQASFDNSGIPF